MASAPSSSQVIRDNVTSALETAEALINLSSTTTIQSEPSQEDKEVQTDSVDQSEVSQQTENISLNASVQVNDLTLSLQDKNTTLHKQQQAESIMGVHMIEGNDKLTQTFTGLPSWAMFVHLFLYLSPFTVRSSNLLSTDNQMFLVLLKLRLNLIYEDLALRFGISTSTVQRVINRWIDVMYCRLKFLIKWPSREVIWNNLPPNFQELYPCCTCIIDCSEIFIETPNSFCARSSTYSNYKKHNTVKFLVGITPNGCVSFLSKCWGGRVSDKQLTQESGFFNLLEPGDTILADRGFTIEEDIAVHGAKLQIPSFTRGKTQLSQREVEQSQQLARVRIHVERIIGLLKNKYTILKGPLPVHLIKHSSDKDISNIDKILTVCASLCNLSHKVV